MGRIGSYGPSVTEAGQAYCSLSFNAVSWPFGRHEVVGVRVELRSKELSIAVDGAWHDPDRQDYTHWRTEDTEDFQDSLHQLLFRLLRSVRLI